MIALISILVLENLVLIVRLSKVDGRFHIDRYPNGIMPRIEYLKPTGDLARRKRLILRIDITDHEEEYYYDDDLVF